MRRCWSFIYSILLYSNYYGEKDRLIMIWKRWSGRWSIAPFFQLLFVFLEHCLELRESAGNCLFSHGLGWDLWLGWRAFFVGWLFFWVFGPWSYQSVVKGFLLLGISIFQVYEELLTLGLEGTLFRVFEKWWISSLDSKYFPEFLAQFLFFFEPPFQQSLLQPNLPLPLFKHLLSILKLLQSIIEYCIVFFFFLLFIDIDVFNLRFFICVQI